MPDWFQRDPINRKRRAFLEEQIGAAVLDLLYGSDTDGQSYVSRPVSYETIRYLDPEEIKWRPQTGEVIYSYKDEPDQVMFSRAKIILSCETGRILLHCGPLQPDDAPRMEAPESGQA